MAVIYYPTQIIIEKYLVKMFKGLATGCLKSSIGIIGKDSDFHKTPGKYGTLPVKVNSITGVDIPVMVYVDDNEKNKNETIAIIAQDPLRNTEDKKLQPFAPNYPNPIVGTPFALHYDSRCYPQTVVYRKIICELLKKGYNVYATDIWKSWAKEGKRERWNNSNPHFQCLAEEIDAINPKYVILMGNQAQSKFNKKAFQKTIKNKPTPICVPHPSNAANGTWSEMGISCTPECKADYIVGLVK